METCHPPNASRALNAFCGAVCASGLGRVVCEEKSKRRRDRNRCGMTSQLLLLLLIVVVV